MSSFDIVGLDEETVARDRLRRVDASPVESDLSFLREAELERLQFVVGGLDEVADLREVPEVVRLLVRASRRRACAMRPAAPFVPPAQGVLLAHDVLDRCVSNLAECDCITRSLDGFVAQSEEAYRAVARELCTAPRVGRVSSSPALELGDDPEPLFDDPEPQFGDALVGSANVLEARAVTRDSSSAIPDEIDIPARRRPRVVGELVGLVGAARVQDTFDRLTTGG